MRLTDLTAVGLAAAACALAAGPGAASANSQLQSDAGPRSHVCSPDAAPPMAAMPFEPMTPRPLQPKVEPPEPAQFMGCLERDYALRPIKIADAVEAIAIADDPDSIAAIFDYRSTGQRDGLIADWLRNNARGGITPGGLTISINGWSNTNWRLPERIVVNAMFADEATSGRLCIVRADSPTLPDALPALNNWCMDRLDLWAD